MKINSFRSRILIFALLFSIANICAADQISTKPVAEFEGGKLYSAGKFRVLELSGTYRQMGRQYGRLMSDPMTEMYKEVVSQYAKNRVVCSNISLDDFSLQLFRLYPRRFQELAEGMSETSELVLNKIIVLND